MNNNQHHELPSYIKYMFSKLENQEEHLQSSTSKLKQFQTTLENANITLDRSCNII